MSSFSHISNYLPKFSKYFQETTVEKCIKKMADKKHGKPLVKFVESALKAAKWQTDPALKSLLDHAITRGDALSKKHKQKLEQLTQTFKAQISPVVPQEAKKSLKEQIAEAEKQVEAQPDHAKAKYALACLYMENGEHIAALALLKVALKQKTQDLALQEIKDKIKICKEKVPAETQTVAELAKKVDKAVDLGRYVPRLAKGKVSKDIRKIVKKTETLLPIEAALIRVYTGSYYRVLNTYLRKGAEGLNKYFKDEDVKEKKQKDAQLFLEKTVPIIKHAMKKLPSLRTLHSQQDVQGRTVFRGTVASLDYIQKLQNELQITDAGFLSASTSQKTALDFAHSIGSKKNQEPLFFVAEGLSGVPISQISEIKSEKEVLFPPNTQFQISEIKKVMKDDAFAKTLPTFPKNLSHLWVVKMNEKVIV